MPREAKLDLDSPTFGRNFDPSQFRFDPHRRLITVEREKAGPGLYRTLDGRLAASPHWAGTPWHLFLLGLFGVFMFAVGYVIASIADRFNATAWVLLIIAGLLLYRVGWWAARWYPIDSDLDGRASKS